MRTANQRKHGGGVTAAFFNVDDVVTYGKYQNQRARIVAFADDGKGNPLVELEPIPKGKKKNKTVALFKIRHSKSDKKTAARVASRYVLQPYNLVDRYLMSSHTFEDDRYTDAEPFLRWLETGEGEPWAGS